MDEIALALSAQQGDLNAFNRLVLEYQDLAFNVAYRMLGDSDAAADASQNAFISAYRHLSTYRGGSFKSWVMRIVTNTCYDELRRQKRRPTTPLEPLNDENQDENDSPEWMKDGQPSPESMLESNELENAIQSCLQKMKEDFRLVVILVDIQGMDYQEVSDDTGMPLGTIKSRLARARGKLRDCLQYFRELLPANYRLDDEGNL
ncbi:MAG: RNA polymerase subunit sigma-24 [Chloroflexi bacterium HGW-Chloroflexi-8]|nr:MAG: RNA polymerase subunit sigma-24 [Chloroflexi bacterium HGW-Chloroflexi-8]